MHHVIPKKMCGTGAMGDLASEHHDRIVDGPGDYAVVYAAVYNAGYTTHTTAAQAARRAWKLDHVGYRYMIIDAKRGVTYDSMYEWMMDQNAPDLPVA